MKSRKLLVFIILLLLFLFSATVVQAHADSIVIENDGSVNLNIEQQVMGVSVLAVETKKTPEPPKVVSVRTVPITSGSTPTRVTIQPSKQEGKKVTVTVTETKSATVNAPPQTGAPKVVSTQTVDKVILKGANNTTVVSIGAQTESPSQPANASQTPAPSPARGLTIEQEGVRATTSLPIQIDSKTHVLSTPSSQGEVKLLLPKTAQDALTGSGLFKSAPSNLLLTPDKTGDVNYSVVTGGKLFGVLPISPETVSVSNTSGKVSAPLLFRVLLPFLR